jgi:hypothetical protein
MRTIYNALRRCHCPRTMLFLVPHFYSERFFMRSTKFLSRLSPAFAIIAACGTAFADFPLATSQASFVFTAPQGTTFTIDNGNSFVWAWAGSVFAAPNCGCPLETGLDLDINLTAATADGGSGCGESGVSSDSFSNFIGLSSSTISWAGVWIGEGGGVNCVPDLCLAFGGYGAHMEFDSDGAFTIPNPDCPSPSANTSNGRRVDVNMFCLPTGPIVSYIVSYESSSVAFCSSTPTSLGAGSYSIDYISITIEDARHDVTGDARFNQDDIDFLVNNVVGTPMASDPLYTDRFEFNGNEVVDGDDINILQCFVDACLDARRIGDANCDNVIDCADLMIAGVQPFAGESFTGSVYNVGLDADLDGDNDADDKEALRDVLLSVEPANYSLDTILNFFDNSAFIGLFNAGDLRADVNGDGTLNFFDVSAWITAFSSPNCLAPGS